MSVHIPLLNLLFTVTELQYFFEAKLTTPIAILSPYPRTYDIINASDFEVLHTYKTVIQ